MNEVVYQVLAIVGLTVAVIAEVDICLHRKWHNRRKKARRVSDR